MTQQTGYSQLNCLGCWGGLVPADSSPWEGTINDKIYSAPGLGSDPQSPIQINPKTMRQTARFRGTFPSPFPVVSSGGSGVGLGVCLWQVPPRWFSKQDLGKAVSQEILGKVGSGWGREGGYALKSPVFSYYREPLGHQRR